MYVILVTKTEIVTPNPNPTPIVRISVENNSAAKTYKAQNEPEIANLPANEHHVAAIAVASVSDSDTSIKIIDVKQHTPPSNMAPQSNTL